MGKFQQIFTELSARDTSIFSFPDDNLKPTGLDLHCLPRQGISGFSRTRVNENKGIRIFDIR